MILDGCQDHIVPHIAGKDIAKEMWDALVQLYQNPFENRKMVLKEKLRTIKMQKGESVTSYLTRIQGVRDELAPVGEKPVDGELVRVALIGFTKGWATFVQGITGRDKFLDWERLWSDFTQEEFQLNLVEASSNNGKGCKGEKEEENLALAGKGKKGKTKSENNQKSDKNKKDLSKIKCFHCHEFGHYASKCPNWKKKGSNKDHVAASTEVDGFDSQFEKDFSLIACMANSVGSNTWHIDSGASFHMTRNREYFIQLEEKDLQMNIELGDDGKLLPRGLVLSALRGSQIIPFVSKMCSMFQG